MLTRNTVLAFLTLLVIQANAVAQLNIASFKGLDQQQDWPWWRGPARDGIVGEHQSVPTKFGQNEAVLWKSPVPGRGHGSPIVVGNRVFLATADETRQTQGVLAYDLQTGKPLWQKLISRGGFPEANHPKNTEASSTIASDGARLFVPFFHHKQVQLTCMDLDGRQIWQKTVAPFNPRKYQYGYAASPVLYGDMVIVAAEYDGRSFISAFNAKTGGDVWRIPRAANITFSSPVIANVAGRDQLLISGSEQVSSYDPKTGQALWSVPGTTAATCGTMVWEGDTVFASGGYPKAETIAVRADGSGTVVWRNNKKCYEQSMIVVDGYLYGLTDRGVLYCWRTQDGNEMWRARLSGPVSASPIYVGGHIYWANESGVVFVFRPNAEKFELVAENRLGNESFASPAVAQNKLLLRIAEGSKPNRQEYLVAIGQP